MGLESFYSSARRLPPAGRLPVGGEWLEVRHLTVAEAFELWDRLRPILGAWSSFFVDERPLEQRDLSWVEPLYRSGLEVLYREHGEAWLEERLGRATHDELRAVYEWFVEAHEWRRILSGLFSIDFDDEGAVVASTSRRRTALEVLVAIELTEDGRRVEEMLSMRAEAFLDWLDARAAVLERRRREYRAASRGGQVVEPGELGFGQALGLTVTHEPAPAAESNEEGDA